MALATGRDRGQRDRKSAWVLAFQGISYRPTFRWPNNFQHSHIIRAINPVRGARGGKLRSFTIPILETARNKTQKAEMQASAGKKKRKVN